MDNEHATKIFISNFSELLYLFWTLFTDLTPSSSSYYDFLLLFISGVDSLRACIEIVMSICASKIMEISGWKKLSVLFIALSI